MPINAIAQTNLVPNGNFEESHSCDVGITRIDTCVGWTSWTNGSPDYYKACSNHPWGGVPSHLNGYQPAASGSSYVGLDYGYNVNGPNMEYVTRTIPNLQRGMKYEVSLSVSLSNARRVGVNDINVFFFDVNLSTSTLNTTALIPVTPQVQWDGTVVTDTQNWVRLTKEFTADSAYDNIVIGGFKHDTAVTRIPATSTLGTYYYIDSVVLKGATRNLNFDYDDTLACAGDSITIPYIVTDTLGFADTNTFTLQLSDEYGYFSNYVVLGTKTGRGSDSFTVVIPANTKESDEYRLRIMSDNVLDSFQRVVPLAIGNLDSADILVSSNSPLCADDTIKFTTTHSAGSITYSWAGPGAYSATDQNPYIAGAQASDSGTYYATIKNHGCIYLDTLAVVVLSPVDSLLASSNSIVCSGDTLKLSVSPATSGVSYSWQGPNSFSSAVQNPTVANAGTTASGLYTVTGTKNGCSRSASTMVSVVQPPSMPNVGSNSPLCTGDTLNLTSATSVTGTVYSWTGPGNFTSSVQNPAIFNTNTNNTGWYKVSLSLNGCTRSDSVGVAVNTIPAQPALSYTNPVCATETLSLFATNVAGAIYTWSGPNSFTSNSQNPTRINVSINDTGVYRVYTSRNGCNAQEVSVRVSVNPTPFAVIFTGKDTICQNESAMFTALPSNAGTKLKYEWFVNAQPAGAQSTFTTTQLSHMSVVNMHMTDSTQCSVPYTDVSNDIQMSVLPWLAPSVSISVTPTGAVPQDSFLTFTANASNAGNPPLYQWKRNGSDVVGATSNVWGANTLNDNDNISVEVQSTYRCPQPQTVTSNGIVVKILSDVNNIEAIKGLTVYPNPNRGTFVVDGIVDGLAILNASIYSVTGQMVYSNKIPVKQKTVQHQFNVGHLPGGVYMLLLESGGKKSTIRFSVTK